jgi:hypothetical protein
MSGCLAPGPDGLRHMFAGCTIAYDSKEKRTYAETGSAPVIMESDASALAPMRSWNPIAGALPATAGSITRIVVIPRIRRIVVTCAQIRGGDTGGIFWATIPVTRFAPRRSPRSGVSVASGKDCRLTRGARILGDLWSGRRATTGRATISKTSARLRSRCRGGYAGGGMVVGQWTALMNPVLSARCPFRRRQRRHGAAIRQLRNCGCFLVPTPPGHAVRTLQSPTELWTLCCFRRTAGVP